MDRVPVASSTIASVGFDDATLALEVEFQNGLIYQYFDVPRAVFDSLLAAESPGGFFNEQVRGSYRYART